MKKYLLLIIPVFLMIIAFSFLKNSNTSYASIHAFSSSFISKIFGQGSTPPANDSTQNDGDTSKNPGSTSDNQTAPPSSNQVPGISGNTPIKTEPEQQPMLVVIDPGHGGIDPGTSDNGVVEKNVTLDICLKLNTLLKNAKINTYMIRTGDTNIDHKERINIANNMNATLYISIHCDWFKDSIYNGTATLYNPSKTLSMGNLTELDYAKIIQNELIGTLKTNNRGTAERGDIAVLRLAKMPSVLVEMGFLSNKGDAERLGDESFRQKAAEALAEGIKKSLAKITAK